MDEMTSGRRPFLKTCAVMAAAVVPTVIGTAEAATEEHHHGKMMGSSGADGYVMPSSTKMCGACDNWGGPRRISRDGKTITFTGLGWCNNPKCPDYQNMSGPDHMCHEGCWRKWGALG